MMDREAAFTGYGAATSSLEQPVHPRYFRWARFVLLTLLLAAPLAFGAVEPWAWGAMGVAVALVLALWGAGCIANRAVVLAWSGVDSLLLAFWLFIVLQRALRLTQDMAQTTEALLKVSIVLLIFFLARQLYHGARSRSWDTLGIVVLGYASLLGLGVILHFWSSPEPFTARCHSPAARSVPMSIATILPGCSRCWYPSRRRTTSPSGASHGFRCYGRSDW